MRVLGVHRAAVCDCVQAIGTISTVRTAVPVRCHGVLQQGQDLKFSAVGWSRSELEEQFQRILGIYDEVQCRVSLAHKMLSEANVHARAVEVLCRIAVKHGCYPSKQAHKAKQISGRE